MQEVPESSVKKQKTVESGSTDVENEQEHREAKLRVWLPRAGVLPPGEGVQNASHDMENMSAISIIRAFKHSFGWISSFWVKPDHEVGGN